MLRFDWLHPFPILMKRRCLKRAFHPNECPKYRWVGWAMPTAFLGGHSPPYISCTLHEFALITMNVVNLHPRRFKSPSAPLSEG
jgi:hypothetical protein